MIKKTLLFFLLSFSSIYGMAQVTLDECKQAARNNYPMIKQYHLIEMSRNYTMENAKKGYLPQVSLSARATYQSDVTKIPVSIPGINIKGMSKDQYDANVIINQVIYDGGGIATNQTLAKSEADVKQQQLNVSMYDINGKVNDMFFAILTLDEQIKQVLLLQQDLAISDKSIKSMIKGGIANQTDEDAISVELIQAQQKEKSLRISRKSFVSMLSVFTGMTMDDGTVFQKPECDTNIIIKKEVNNRPELEMYNAQSRLLNEKTKSLDVALRPKVGVFLQGGYGKPALNMLKNEFELYYKAGVNLSWNFGSLYTKKNDKEKIELDIQTVESNIQTFLLNSDIQTENKNGAIDNLKRQIEDDEKIISLRERIRSKSEKKVAGGTETVNEMLRDINAVSEARQTKSLHEIQLIQEIYNLKNIVNQ